jgi:hypothetical protein
VLHRARRDGSIEVAWFSPAEKACHELVRKGWLRENIEKTIKGAFVGTITYDITEEGKRG